MFALSIAAAALAPPPAPPPGTPPTTLADLIRIEGTCSLSVLIVGDDGLSQQFNSAVIDAVKKSEGKFCRRAIGNYVIFTNSNVVPITSHSFRYRVTAHDARDFIANHDSGREARLGEAKGECKTRIKTCASQAVDVLIRTLEAR
jgi:hypothetical protein